MSLRTLFLMALLLLFSGCSGKDGSSVPDGGDTDTDTELPDPDDYVVEELYCGSRNICVLTAAGGVKCWGDSGALGNGLMNVGEPTPRYVVGLNRGVASISSPGVTAFALKEDGTVWGWGDNFYQQLGAGLSSSESDEPVQVQGLEGDEVTQISNGGFHACALISDGSAKCWGRNDEGELGNGVDLSTCVDVSDCMEPFPVEMALENPLEEMFWGLYAVDSEGRFLFWSDLGYWGGEYGEESSVAVPFQGFEQGEVACVSGVEGASCALTSDKAVKCWTTGSNTDGALGNGTTDETHDVVEVVGLDEDVVDLSYCAVLESGKVMCWGPNDRAQLGIGSTDYDPHPVPQEVMGLDGKAVAICNRCALMEDGSIKCWGEVPGVMLEEEYEECNEWYCFYPRPGTVPGFGPAAPTIGTPEDYNHETELVGTWDQTGTEYPRRLVITENQIVMTGSGQYTEHWSVVWRIVNASNTLDRLKLEVVEVDGIGYGVGDVRYLSYVLEKRDLTLYREDRYEYPIPLGGSNLQNYHTYFRQ